MLEMHLNCRLHQAYDYRWDFQQVFNAYSVDASNVN